MTFIAVALGLGLFSPIQSSSAPKVDGRPVAIAPATDVVGNINDLRWMQGRWKGKAFGGTIEEEFSLPGGGCVLGISRITGSNDRLIFKEFMELTQTGTTLTYTVTVPNKIHTFSLGKFGPNEVMWVDPSNKFPQSIHYRREGDSIHVVLKGVQNNGSPQEEVIRMDRVKE
jgi:hypothetical protein